MHVWIDIENPPQVQYLLPFRRAFEELDARVTVTARDYGDTYALLRAAGVPFEPVGSSYGKGKARKVAGLARRTRALRTRMAKAPRPDALVCAGRASVLAARALGVPSFVLGDYEYVHVALYRLTRSFLVFPDVVDPEAFAARGIARDRLLPYRGIKEDLTFAGVDVESVEPWRPRQPGAPARVLFRPPAEESHYYRSASGDLARAALAQLAAREDVEVVFSPRYPSQLTLLEEHEWRRRPLVLDRAVPFVSLLKGVDAVVSSGGTMLREAAWLGVPAYSIFAGEIGGVDRHLAALGRLRLIDDPGDLAGLAPGSPERAPLLRSNPALLDTLAGVILERSGLPRAVPDPVPSTVAAGSPPA